MAASCSNSLHETRGSGSGSRMRVDISKLEGAGWTIVSRESGDRVRLSFINPEGQKFHSAKDVEQRLEAEETLCHFFKEECKDNVELVESGKCSAGKESDEEYEPLMKQKACEDLRKSG